MIDREILGVSMAYPLCPVPLPPQPKNQNIKVIRRWNILMAKNIILIKV